MINILMMPGWEKFESISKLEFHGMRDGIDFLCESLIVLLWEKRRKYGMVMELRLVVPFDKRT